MDTIGIVELVKVIGFPAVIFVIWYITQKSNDEKWKSIFDEIKQTNQNYYNLLTKQTDILDYHTQLLIKIDQKLSKKRKREIVNE